MGIKFSCECGKHFSASEEHAGKQIRCPKCGRALKVPALEAFPSEAKQAPEASEPEMPQGEEARSEEALPEASGAEEPKPEWPEPTAAAFPPPARPRVVVPAHAKPGALVPLTIFLCVVALGVSIGGFFVYLKTAKEIDRLNKRVVALERQQHRLEVSVRALKELVASRPAKQAKPQAQVNITDPKLNALLKMGLEAMGQHNKAIQELLDDPTGAKK